MTFSARDRKRATAVTVSMNVETTWRLATRGNTCVVRPHGWTSGEIRVPVRVQRVGAWEEEMVEWVRKDWRIVAASGLAGVDLGGGGIRIWELKPSKELKRITVDLSGLRLSERLSVYSIVLWVIRMCVRQRILAVLWTSNCRVSFHLRLQASAKNFLNLKIDKNKKFCLICFSL